MRASSFDEALQIANGSPYKLTGGLFSRTPSHIARARADFRVGNLYLNRGCTGALVGRQPFGGFGLSGGGSPPSPLRQPTYHSTEGPIGKLWASIPFGYSGKVP